MKYWQLAHPVYNIELPPLPMEKHLVIMLTFCSGSKENGELIRWSAINSMMPICRV